MKFAQREDGTFIYAVELIDDEGNKLPITEAYVCSQCKGPVYLKNGKDTRPHFAHYAQAIKDHIKVNESDVHFDQKHLIHQQLKALGIDSVLEYAIENKLRRADVYIPNQAKVSHDLTIELQYATISAEDVYKRQADYQAVNCRVMWLLGYQSKYQDIFGSENAVPSTKTLNSIRPFLKYTYEYGFYLPFWHEGSSKVMILTLDLYGQPKKQIRMSIERYMRYFNDHYHYEQGDFITGLLFGKDQPLQWAPASDLEGFIKKVLVSPTTNQQKILEILYQRQTHLQNASPEIFTYKGTSIFSKVSDWAIILAYESLGNKDAVRGEKTHFAQLANLLMDKQLVIDHPFFTKEIIASWLMWLLAYYERN